MKVAAMEIVAHLQAHAGGALEEVERTRALSDSAAAAIEAALGSWQCSSSS